MTPIHVRRAIALAAGIVAIVLALVVIIGSPHDPTRLLAWAAFALGVGLVVEVAPVP